MVEDAISAISYHADLGQYDKVLLFIYPLEQGYPGCQAYLGPVRVEDAERNVRPRRRMAQRLRYGLREKGPHRARVHAHVRLRSLVIGELFQGTIGPGQSDRSDGQERLVLRVSLRR